VLLHHVPIEVVDFLVMLATQSADVVRVKLVVTLDELPVLQSGRLIPKDGDPHFLGANVVPIE
jgi:hypothetical protein